MQILRLNNINLHAPYKVMQDPEKEFNFYFVSSLSRSLTKLYLFFLILYNFKHKRSLLHGPSTLTHHWPSSSSSTSNSRSKIVAEKIASLKY